MQPTRNTLSGNIRVHFVELPKRHLAASIDLRTQLKQACRNVHGPCFTALQELIDKISAAVENYSGLAERAGGTLHSTIQIMADRSLLVTYVSAQLLRIGTHSLFPAASQRSADRYQRPSIKRQPLAMQMPPPRCPYSMHGIYSTSP
ncbi:MAG: hypothetical protein WDN46_04730 [Methylocella sp.]